MCGIAGFTHVDGRPAPEIIRHAAAAIRHRGPDQQGVYSSASVSLAAVRLKIRDLSDGGQPMRSSDGSTVICFNGEIYNADELRRDLESAGHRLRSRCDTEVALYAWIEWGNGCFERLHGMFATAIWHEPTRRLVLARDRLGIKPLYLYRRGADLHFGSELKSILVHPGVPRELDFTGLAAFLSLNYIPQPHTLVDGITKLAPGSWLEWNDGRIWQDRYWRLKFDPRPRTLAAAKEELDFLLSRSIREHLVADVPLGVWLSGGLDSSTITHYASRLASGQLKTFSVSFRGRSFDETPYFQAVANAYGTDHYELDMAPSQELADAIEQIAHFSDEPSADAGALPVYFLSRMTREHVTVALSGEGADELFGGYATYLADRYAARARRIPAAWRRAALGLANLLPVSNDKVSFEYKLKRFLAGTLLAPTDAHLFWNGAFSAAERREIFPAKAGFTPAELCPLLPDLEGVERFLYLDQLLYLPEDILYKCDRMSMAHSLEVRPPFLDHRIVEFAATLPENLKIRGRRLKFLLRELMRDQLPRAVVSRSKQGFDIPTHHWFRTELKPLLLDTVNEASVKQTPLKWPAVSRMLSDHLASRANYGYQLWGLVTFLLWHKRYLAKPAEAATMNELLQA